MIHRTLLLAILCTFTVSAANPWTVDDILLQERAGSYELSKDGRYLVYVKGRMDKEKGEAVSNLYLKHLADNFEIQLTQGKDNYSSPRFAPDGKRIAFLTSRRPADSPAGGSAPAAGAPGAGGGMQIWIIDVRGGEPAKITSLEKGVRSFAWLDNDSFLISAPEDDTLTAQKVKDRKDTSQVVDDEKNAAPVRLYKYVIKGNKTTRLTENADRISSVELSPDGKWAVTRHDRSLSYVFNQKVRPATYLFDLSANQSTQLFAGGKLLPGRIQWSPDSKGFYFSAPFTNHPQFINASVQRLYWFDLASRKETQVNLDWERGLGFGLAATPDGVVALLADGVRSKPARYTRAGGQWTRAWLEGEHAANLSSVWVSEDGKSILYTTATASQPARAVLAKLDGPKITEPKTVVEANAGFLKKTLAKTETITWKGALDEEVEGILYYPHNYEKGRKYALVVMIHGGPHGHDQDAFNESMAYPHQLYAQRGAFILKPNYHGSSGYGLKWSESISGGKYNDLEWIDVEKGVDSLIARGFVDPEKLGVLGWSNGSIITIELTTRTTRYKAAGAGAGDVNWLSDWGNAVFGHAFDAYYLGKTPMEDPMFYVKKSPLFRMDKVRTPTIIFFGTEDKQVPTEQGWQHFRALQHYGQTDVRFLLFPGEAHGPRKYVHQRRKLEEELAWFDQHLFGTAKDENEALKADSPLAAAWKLSKTAEAPETAERGTLAIARFEVTRAQYAAFDPNYRYPAGAANYPASGVTFEQAKAYAAWLAKKTGQDWRLPTEEEMSAHLRASRNENTLDHWAGYSVNPEDAKKLSSLIEGLGPGALLKPAGSFPGSGEDPIFDLAGNAAEWVVAKDGQGKALGGSADRPADAKAGGTARPDYTGLRVVRSLK